MSILEIRDLEVVYRGRDGTPVRAVAGTSLSVDVEPAASGEVIFDGQRVQVLGRRARTKRDARLQMVFQNPYGSLNPRRTIGDQVADGLLILSDNSRGQKGTRVADLLRRVGLSADVAERHPHQLS